VSSVTTNTATTNQTATTSSTGDQMSRRTTARTIDAIISSNRCNGDSQRVIFKMQTHVQQFTMGRTDLDSHADTCCAGATAHVIEYTGKTCDVSPFSKEYNAICNVPIVKAATAYDDPVTGETFILIMGQALYFGDWLEHSLLCPNQMRANGIEVDDVPMHLASNGASTHSLYSPSDDVRIKLRLHGCLSYIPTRLPTAHEIENCPWVILTSDSEWDPYTSDFEEKEMLVLADLPPQEHERQIYAMSLDHCIVPSALASVSNIVTHDMSYVSSVLTEGDGTSTTRRFMITQHDLAKRWRIGVHTAAQTLQVTTQKGIRNAVHPIQRWF
jgi:hypothetical protein